MADCYLGLLLHDLDDAKAAGVLIVSRPCCCTHPYRSRYELGTGHPDRAPGELGFPADLTLELRAWPADTWSEVGIDPQAAAHVVVAGWQRHKHLVARPVKCEPDTSG